MKNSRERRGWWGAVACLGALLGCDVPTDLPVWDQQWTLPVEDAVVEVEEFLPTGVSADPAQDVFLVDIDPLTLEETLGDLCGACQTGFADPKPAFQATFQDFVELPADVREADVVLGRVSVVLRNGFTFDPIRPGGGATGILTFSLYDGSAAGRLLDRVVLDGAGEGLPPGTDRTETLEFTGTVGNRILTEVVLASPEGSGTNLDVTDRLALDVGVADFQVQSALVEVAGRHLTMEDSELDVADMDETVVDKIRSGSLAMEIQNPWGVAAEYEVAIHAQGSVVRKEFSIPSGATSSAQVQFTGAELQSFLGREGVVLRGTGVVDQGAAPVSLRPGEELVMDNELTVVIRIGEEGEG